MGDSKGAPLPAPKDQVGGGQYSAPTSRPLFSFWHELR